MTSASCRLLPYAVASGPVNMAADDALLEIAQTGVASLRFYGWSEPTVSLGYFQPEGTRASHPLLAGLPFVRRPTGGDALVHHHEVTYALALPAGAPWQTGLSWLPRLHAIISAALERMGVIAPLSGPAERPRFQGVLCFQHVTPGDLVVGLSKVVGSAQRRQRGALLQHGGILLSRSPHAPELPGIRELSGQGLTPELVYRAVTEEFIRQTGWRFPPAEWSSQERERIADLVANKYANPAWNQKR